MHLKDSAPYVIISLTVFFLAVMGFLSTQNVIVAADSDFLSVQQEFSSLPVSVVSESQNSITQVTSCALIVFGVVCCFLAVRSVLKK